MWLCRRIGIVASDYGNIILNRKQPNNEMRGKAVGSNTVDLSPLRSGDGRSLAGQCG